MSTPADTHDHHGHDHDDGYDHGTHRSYIVGFLLSAILTAIPFALVMTGVLPKPVAAAAVVGFAIVQIVVQMIYFLHMNPRSEGGWNMLALVFTVIIVVIAVSGSLWVMHHLNTNMMPPHEHDIEAVR
ncbi:cytochrome o ubiquinol oxidase subunit IV [Caulobacter mirabilis]|uniref:Cytochrome bo(3) ubiquinol oxidase subunit 4 n=1 Tax=Caulobacter mirabilis TaxID=69666 RepID=A0A2D2AY75_9CAUL|nr:cytochrome o ubiquinol oxidase subunit IV [Caulobacter mirabilis]ATQ42945.1 cytochrome o ubiquinol oxidase subunit IV [Caulobacter mirabilis]